MIGFIVRKADTSDDDRIEGNKEFREEDMITMEVNMAVERRERTLHFFVNGNQQPISLFNLPNRVKFCVLRRFPGQIVKIFTFEKVSKSQVVNDIPDAQAIQWKDEDELATELLRQQP
ncbi:MAG: hypothetical protein EZS28_034888 [Streblomastix strix]|uniref:Uncharacterized protein n=1 Tax=Streblomastix strix TaxID=222440 RepID=A0A5J4UJ20_9EUKA|nr:MAG: hypothetical protein EZS28_034888 [Streblomastix strix]